jgi:Tfp pilus assembly protein PilF
MSTNEGRGPGGVRRYRFAIALASPILFLLAMEAVLSVAGIGGAFPLFIPAEGIEDHLEPNAQVIQRYFPGRTAKLGIDPIPFAQRKPDAGFRIVVQGGSTAAGFPYGRWAGLAGMLGDRLEATHPDREIEVISTAVAGVNSYTLLDFCDEIIAIEPDAVLIYAGHNEYLGIFGVGSALTPSRSHAATLLHLKLSRLRVYQAMQMSIGALRGLFTGTGEDAAAGGMTMMARAATSKEIPYETDVFHRGIAQFVSNLNVILARYRDAGIPVYIGTLASNERDLPPFAGGVASTVDRAEWESIWNEAMAALEGARPDAARTQLRRLLEIDEDAADVWFALARVAFDAGDFEVARAAFREARDRDRLRFRAPKVFNDRIRELAQRHGATLVDVRAHLADFAPAGVPGDELMLEHLHPNARGYFLLADAYYAALAADRVIGDGWGSRSREDAMRDMPITAIDELLAQQSVREIKADYPFVASKRVVPFPAPKNEIAGLALQRYREEIDWRESMQGLLRVHLARDERAEALVVARITAQAFPTLKAPNAAAARLMMRSGDFARARRYLERSLALDPKDQTVLQALIRANVNLGDEERAQIHVDQLKRIAPDHPRIKRYEARLRQDAETAPE